MRGRKWKKNANNFFRERNSLVITLQYLCFYRLITMLLPPNIYAFTPDFPPFFAPKAPLFMANFYNILIVRGLQNQRESHICGRKFWRGFHLLKYWLNAQKREVSTDKYKRKIEKDNLEIRFIALPCNASEPYFWIMHYVVWLFLNEEWRMGISIVAWWRSCARIWTILWFFILHLTELCPHIIHGISALPYKEV